VIRFSASLTTLFTEAPLDERFALAKRAGFAAVECQQPYGLSAQEIAGLLDKTGLTMALLNAPAGDWERGERGFAALAGREAQFRGSVERGLEYCRAAGCSQMHVLAGIPEAGTPADQTRAAYIANLRHAAERARQEGVRILIEPLNAADAPGYFLNCMSQAAEIVSDVGHENLWLQYDIYHARMTGEPLAETFRDHPTRIAHIQIAGVPGRHEPIPSEIPYPDLFQLIDNSGYRGWIGCEYRPRAGTLAGLEWMSAYGFGPERG